MADERLGNLNPRELNEIRTALTGFQDDLGKAFGEMKKLQASTVEGISNSFVTSTNAVKDLAKFSAEELQTAKGREKVEKELAKITKDQTQNRVNILILEEQLKTASGKYLTDINKALVTEYRRKDALTGAATAAGKLAQASKEVVKSGDGFEKVSKMLSGIPIIGNKLGIISKPFEEASAAARKASSDGLSEVEAKLKGIEKLSGLIALSFGTMIFNAILKSAKQAGELNKQFGLGLDNAREMRQRFVEVSERSNDTRINASKLVEASRSLNTSLGISIELSDKTLQTYIKNTEYLGASAEAASKISQLSINTNQTAEQYSATIAQTANSAGKALGVYMPTSKIMEKIKDASATTLLNLRGNPEALTKAVLLSEKLGISFQQLRNTANSLLDFESSISNELEAELLVGRELNLERARAAALTGNDVVLMQELSNQVGTLNDFTRMNVIQRESLAQAFGMSADAMGDMLFKQDMINKLGEKARDMSIDQLRAAEAKQKADGGTMGDALLAVQREQDVTKRFSDIVQKLKENFVEFFSKLESTGILDKLASFGEMIASSPLTKIIQGIGASGMALVFGGAKLMSALRGTPALPMVVTMVGQGMTSAGSGIGALMNGTAFGSNKIVASVDKNGKTFYHTAGNKMDRKSAQAGQAAKTGRQMARGAGLAGAGMLIGGAMQEYGGEGMQAAGSFISGASSGAMMGMMFGPIGAGIGAAVGGGMSLLTSYLEKKSKEEQELKDKEARKKAEDNDYYKKVYESLEKSANQKTSIYLDTVLMSNTIQQFTPGVE